MIAALQNSVLVAVILASLRQLRILPQVAFARPYVVMMCVLYTAAFCCFFAALGNQGLITREATGVLPFFLVPLCIPRGPRHRPPRYVWELRLRDRIARRRALARRAAAPGPRRAART
jgi:hypothetical protein